MDKYVQELERLERVYCARKSRFQERNVSNERLLLLSDQKPWRVFGQSLKVKRQRRKLVFEHCGVFPKLHEVCVARKYDEFRALVDMPGVCVLSRDACGRIALHHAVINEQLKIAKRLLRRRDAKLQGHCQDNSHRTALHYVLEKMEILAKHEERDGKVPALRTLEMRTKSKRYRRLWKLADKMLDLFSRGELERKWSSGEEIMALDLRCRGDMWDACRSGDLERLETLAKVYGLTEDDWVLRELNWTLLHEACENQQLQVVHYLISAMKIPVVTQDASGCTALHCAARRGCIEACRLLLGKISSSYNEESSIKVDEELVDELVFCQDTRGRTALHWCLLGPATSQIRSTVATFLAQSCLSALLICDEDCISPLHLAIWRGDIELIQQFICLGANVCASCIVTTNANKIEDKTKEKARWAPCGLVFQRHKRLKLPNAAPVVIPPKTPSSNSNNPSLLRKDVVKWENVQHPVEGLWYWAQRSNVHHVVSVVPLSKNSGLSEYGAMVTDEGIGCLKYGATCNRCKASNTNTMTAPTVVISNYRCQRVLSPLLLALRLCALKGRSDLRVCQRVAAIEILLINGALGGDGIDAEDKQVCSVYPSTLAEGFRASLRCPQILPMLLLHGSKQISAEETTRCCFSSALLGNERVETALCQLLGMENITINSEHLTVLFSRKYFHALRKLAQAWTSNQEKECSKGGSPWSAIHDSLSSRKNHRVTVNETREIGLEHLEFLSGLAQPHVDYKRNADKLQLLEYCVDHYLQQQASISTLNSQKAIRKTYGESEHVVLNCIGILLVHWKRVLLQTLHQLNVDRDLLCTIFEFYATALTVRGYREDDQFCHHREFISVCAENLLKSNQSISSSDFQQLVQHRSSVATSMRSIVHMCAYNFPFALIKRCFDLVFPENVTLNGMRVLDEIKAIRISGKTLLEWVATHFRDDVIELLLVRIPAGLERNLLWGEFVAASTTLLSGANDAHILSLLDNLFSIHAEKVQGHLSTAERRELLHSLIVKCAIPNDCVVLMTRLVDCWELNDRVNDDTSDGEPVEDTLRMACIVHSIVRWNAVRIAEFYLRENSPSPSTRINWPGIFTEGVQERHELDGCTPMELCRLLGHNHLYNLLSRSSSIRINTPQQGNLNTEGDYSSSTEMIDREDDKSVRQFGLLRSILCINGASALEKTKQHDTSKMICQHHRCVKFQSRWESAIALNQVSHLQAMTLTGLNATDSAHQLILTAIKHGSLEAFRWVLEAYSPIDKYLSETEGVECLYAAAKHPGDIYADMTRHLLKSKLSPGRLSGDGMCVPLLHRAACFANAPLACCIMTMLLERSDCDVNALDAFGNTAVSYALAAGCLQNACFLIRHLNCRLEAEYEGQSCFYYALHMIPSFPWRAIVREVLVTKRNRAFLHCDADNKTCGCKSFENPRESNTGDESPHRHCGFCGHESTSHRLVPLPSWFRDQYDTYVAETPRRKLSRSSSESSVSQDDETGQHYLSDDNTEEDEEMTLENGRGRLDVALLEQITAIRYDDIVQANGLVLPIAVCQRTTNATASIDEEIGHDGSDLETCATTSHAITGMGTAPEVMAESTMEESLPVMSSANCGLPRSVDNPASATIDQPVNTGKLRKDAKSTWKLTDCPWSLRQALGMVHSPQCSCQSIALVTSQAQFAYIVVCRWLRHTATIHMRQQTRDRSSVSSESAIVVLASVEPAFQHWRELIQSNEPPNAAGSRRPIASPALKRALSQWRYAPEFLAFQRWKNYQSSAEVAHYRLATRLDHLTASMRHSRFLTLQVRQQQLRDASRSLLGYDEDPVAPPPE